MNDQEFEDLLKSKNLYDLFLGKTKSSGQLVNSDWSDEMFTLAVRFFNNHGCMFIDDEYRYINISNFEELLNEKNKRRFN